MDYENIIEDIGGFGHWQRIIFVVISLPDIPTAIALFLPLFAGRVPNWGCVDNSVNQTNNESNVTTDGSVIDIHSLKEGDELSICEQCNKHQFNDSFTTIVSEWDLICDNDYISDLISSLQLAGLVVGSAIFSQISDSFGRKKAYFSSILLLGVGGLLSAFSTNWQMFAALRMIVGISMGGCICVSFVYPLEFISRRWRTLCGTVGFWALGQMGLALLAYFMTDWRYLTATTACVTFPYLLFWWFLPESPRWLLQRGQTKKAQAIFTNIALKNKKAVPNMDFLDSICEATENPKIKYTYLDLFRQKVIAKRTIVCSILWFTLLLAYYEISFNVKNLSGDRYLNVVYGALFDLLGLIAVIIFNNILGRRRCIIISLVIQVAINTSLLVIHVLHKEVKHDSAVTWLALVGKGVATTTLYLIQIYAAELFPTDVRNLGVGAASGFGRIGAILAPQILYLGTKIKVFPFALIGAMCSAVIPLCLIVPETNGKPLVDDFNFKTKRGDHEDIDLKSLDG